MDASTDGEPGVGVNHLNAAADVVPGGEADVHADLEARVAAGTLAPRVLQVEEDRLVVPQVPELLAGQELSLCVEHIGDYSARTLRNFGRIRQLDG